MSYVGLSRGGGTTLSCEGGKEGGYKNKGRLKCARNWDSRRTERVATVPNKLNTTWGGGSVLEWLSRRRKGNSLGNKRMIQNQVLTWGKKKGGKEGKSRERH